MSNYKDSDEKGTVLNQLDKLMSHWNEIDNFEPDDRKLFFNNMEFTNNPVQKLETFDELMERDDQRQKDGFKKKIKIKRLMKDEKSRDGVIVVPFTYEEKLIHDKFQPDSPESTGGQGEGEEGEKTGEQPVDKGDGDGEGDETGQPGQGNAGEHGISKESYELGKELSEKLKLPNLKDKGKKVPIPEWTYDLTDRTRKYGQFLDKKETVKQILKTNLLLGRISVDNIDPTNLLIDPNDKVFKTLSRERQYQSQAIVFFVRDYSGSMHGEPTRITCELHLMLYTWLVYQYNERVKSRFIVHDLEAKEVNDFNEYYSLDSRGGTYVCSGFELVNQIIEEENLDRDYNIYIFFGSDGGDWAESVEKAKSEMKKSLDYCNRLGITIVRNSFFANTRSEVENYVMQSGLLEYTDLARMAVLLNGDEKTLEDAIKHIVSED